MILRVEKVCVSFRKERQKRLFGRERQQVLRDVSLWLKEGESVALVGESGSGKSTLGRVLGGLLQPERGRVLVDGKDLYDVPGGPGGDALRHKISIVFQDYVTSVNPRFRVRDIIGESLRALRRTGEGKGDATGLTVELLEQVGLSGDYLQRYPHELSGGQLQRVCIARAVAIRPEMIVLDEAISSLDASTQTQIMDLLLMLKEKHRFSYFFITHDLTAVTYMCDRVLFFNNGSIVEQVDDMSRLSHVRDDYARRLLDSVIEIDDAAAG
jgi:ABC-type dipeptide/oligopeptide/nickel transport system, ATPase component